MPIIDAMAIRKIALMGQPVLKEPALPIEDPGAPKIRRLVADMLETMYDADGVGLAAPQVYEPVRLVMFMVPADRVKEGEAGAVPLTVLANSVVEPLDDETIEGAEACLSLPGLVGIVPRYRHIRYSGMTPEGESITREASDYHARVVQHEFDHLDGILYPMRMIDLSRLSFASELGPGPRVMVETDE
jgi:peptide deformylase